MDTDYRRKKALERLKRRKSTLKKMSILAFAINLGNINAEDKIKRVSVKRSETLQQIMTRLKKRDKEAIKHCSRNDELVYTTISSIVGISRFTCGLCRQRKDFGVGNY